MIKVILIGGRALICFFIDGRLGWVVRSRVSVLGKVGWLITGVKDHLGLTLGAKAAQDDGRVPRRTSERLHESGRE